MKRHFYFVSTFLVHILKINHKKFLISSFIFAPNKTMNSFNNNNKKSNKNVNTETVKNKVKDNTLHMQSIAVDFFELKI